MPGITMCPDAKMSKAVMFQTQVDPDPRNM